MSHTSYFSQHVRSPMANVKTTQREPTVVDENDPCGIAEMQPVEENVLRVRRQMKDKQILYSEPTRTFLNKYNDCYEGKMSDAEKLEVMAKMNAQIEADWKRKCIESKIPVLDAPHNLSEIIKLHERQAIMEHKLKEATERVSQLEVSSTRRTNKSRRKRNNRRQRRNAISGGANNHIEKIPIALRDWRFRDVVNGLDKLAEPSQIQKTEDVHRHPNSN